MLGEDAIEIGDEGRYRLGGLLDEGTKFWNVHPVICAVDDRFQLGLTGLFPRVGAQTVLSLALLGGAFDETEF
jgi:hypothetical protein